MAAAACTEISSAQARCLAAPAPRFLWGLHVVIVVGAGAKLFRFSGARDACSQRDVRQIAAMEWFHKAMMPHVRGGGHALQEPSG